MFHELAARAPWRMGGAEKVMNAIDDQDLHANQDVQKAITENITERAKDGWKLYQSKTGQRRFLDSTKQAAWNRATPGPTPMVDRRSFRQAPVRPSGSQPSTLNSQRIYSSRRPSPLARPRRQLLFPPEGRADI